MQAPLTPPPSIATSNRVRETLSQAGLLRADTRFAECRSASRTSNVSPWVVRRWMSGME